jgi:hypothetical protein
LPRAPRAADRDGTGYCLSAELIRALFAAIEHVDATSADEADVMSRRVAQ